jgi:hypothetical protein
MTFNDFSNLTAGQRAKLEEFRQIGLSLRGGTPNISGVTDQQAKSAAAFLRDDLANLIDPTEAGVRYVRSLYRDQAVKNYDDSVVAGP